jgi:hypothetical protein
MRRNGQFGPELTTHTNRQAVGAVMNERSMKNIKTLVNRVKNDDDSCDYI